jgi:hypothetical protein
MTLELHYPGLERPGYHQPSLRDENTGPPSSITTISVRRQKRGMGAILPVLGPLSPAPPTGI